MLIRLHGCAGWSASVVRIWHKQAFSRRGSFVLLPWRRKLYVENINGDCQEVTQSLIKVFTIWKSKPAKMFTVYTCVYMHSLLLLLCWCFMAFRHISGHFGRGQLTCPHCSWASLLGSLVHILSSVTDNCPSWIRGREIISWPISTKECCRTWGSNPRLRTRSAYQTDAHTVELPCLACTVYTWQNDETRWSQ